MQTPPLFTFKQLDGSTQIWFGDFSFLSIRRSLSRDEAETIRKACEFCYAQGMAQGIAAMSPPETTTLF